MEENLFEELMANEDFVAFGFLNQVTDNSATSFFLYKGFICVTKTLKLNSHFINYEIYSVSRKYGKVPYRTVQRMLIDIDYIVANDI